MLDAIRDFFGRSMAARPAERHTIELATAALLLEVSRADGATTPVERDAVYRAVRSQFNLDDAEADQLTALAEAEVAEATDTYQFTSLINRQFSREQKIRVIELLWDIAYAEADRNVFEEHVIRKLADLLYIDHPDYINAKFRARDAAAR
jgi:uncharacterized tellurite resistance protein B-like protein